MIGSVLIGYPLGSVPQPTFFLFGIVGLRFFRPPEDREREWPEHGIPESLVILDMTATRCCNLSMIVMQRH
jgi:hypothetical protein